MSVPEISIRSIQHFLYCPHRWGLLEIDRAWAENMFVTKANLMHERVHDPEKSYTLRGKRVFTSVPVYHDGPEYCLYGMTDCMEATENSAGVQICGEKKRYDLCIVEYKPTKPKNREFNEDDQMQIFAQKICVDFVFGGECQAAVYYADVRKRFYLPLQENFTEYDTKLKDTLQEMRKYLKEGKIPPIRKKQKCSGCSMKDLCMPSCKKIISVRGQIKALEGETT